MGAPTRELGFGSGMTCWRRLEEWNRAGVWQQLHALLLAELQGADRLAGLRHHLLPPPQQMTIRQEL
ncbi:hypothetical protein Pme01_11070 [Planosporangium mesophilum]|uniref:Transposase n=1 Tax=Planosporangium mesophilum TaxID=689768 RepID=A0A8J3THD1_9ACTN|nr:hypothetical protein Pme01_11070 [Planosporangium mesophilum]